MKNNNQMNKNEKIYVAGHKGLVGSAIINNLKSKGYSSIIGRDITELDLRDTLSVQKFFENENPKYVILAAAKVGGIVANNTYRAEFIYDNLMIQNNIINEAYKNGVKKLLFLGSTCIYPRECPQPMKENALLSSPLEYTNEPYAIAKIAGIKMCESYNIQYGTNFLSVMPTNLYGPNDNFNLETSHVLPALIRKIHLGKCLEENNWDAVKEDLNKRQIEGITGSSTEEQILEILKKYGISSPDSYSDRSLVQSSSRSIVVEIWGSGKPFREFLWSEEMADACVFVMENVNFSDVIPKKPETRNTHINIGTGKEISIKDLATTIKESIGFNGDFVFNTSKPDGTMQKLTDPSKLHSLGWHHKIEVPEGVKKLYNWYLSN